MDKNSNTYIFLYAVAMVVIVAAGLSLLATNLRPRQEFNEEVQKKQDILAAMHIKSTVENAADIYDNRIKTSRVVNSEGEILEDLDAFEVELKKELDKPVEKRNLPMYIGETDDGEEKIVIPLRGKGLWGPIWGYIALDDDYNTVYGASFAHQAETPGLGAEINTEEFESQFNGKKILDDNGDFVSVDVVKGGVPEDAERAVDAISGGTITSHGLRDMLETCIEPYMTYFNQIKSSEE
ncbi:MAG: NADH:ubiquinone reductase (Na(+)-transporting) subunit C [Bacteroidota bacterium]